MTWDWFVDNVIPYLIHGLVDALFWRFVVVEGRLSRVTLEGENDIGPRTGLDTPDTRTIELENTIRALEQRVAELEQLLED